MKKIIQVSDLKKSIRADIYCCNFFKNISRSKLKTGLQKFFINSKEKKISTIVRNGDIIEIEWIDPIPKFAEPENIPLNIIFEDINCIVVNKAARMVTHPASGNWHGTLVNALNYYRNNVSIFKDEFSQITKNNSIEINTDLYRLGIVHRLDKDTSGTIITARNFLTQEYLKKEFKNRKVKKYYIAILNGIPKQKKGKIKTLMFRSNKNRKKFDCIAFNGSLKDNIPNSKMAVSSYKVLSKNNLYSLVVFRIFTGRTHQIRLHSKFMNCPILGDTIYGKKNDKENFLMLHSYKLILDGKIKGAFKSPLPVHFKKAIKRLNLC